jgi:hypothetical protein
MTMNRRRFMLLAVALVALNTFFWVAQGGFALPRALIDQYFGSRMIRAEVIVQTPAGIQDFQIDRGQIKTLTPGLIVLKEKDDRMVSIQLSPSATVTSQNGRSNSTAVLRRGMRVTVIRLANAPAETIQLESGGGQGGGQ